MSIHRALVAIGVLVLVETGCECSNMGYVADAVIEDSAGEPLKGVTAKTCPVEIEECYSATSDDEGKLGMAIHLYRPKAFACTVREVELTKDGCDPVMIRPDHPEPEEGHRYVMPCTTGTPATTASSTPAASP